MDEADAGVGDGVMVSEADFKALCAEQDRRRDALEALKASAPRPLRFQAKWDSEGCVLVSRDPSKPGRWRVTRFAREDGQWEPLGHREAEDFPKAVELAAEDADLGSLE